jgi:myo-inositol-1(or 4)-monophosphatase
VTLEEDVLIKVAAEAAVNAGRSLLRPFRTGVAARAKVGTHEHDVVTAADAEAEAAIRQALTTAFPDSVVIGEESGGDDAGEVRWYVDPIDGTHNFSRGVPLFCVSIGVTVRGTPVAGCVYDPVHDELFTASGGRFRLNGRPVPVQPPRPGPMLLADVPRPGLVPDATELALFTDLLAAADVRRIGSSALALAYVACGRADAAVTADAFVWDVAAGRTLVTTAGGGFTAVPGEPSAVHPGGFAAWRPGHEELGRIAVTGLRTLLGSTNNWR